MLPNRELAIQELKIAGEKNPGLWTAHSYHVAEVAELIAEACGNLDTEKAFCMWTASVSIGRRTGIAQVETYH